MFNRVFKNPGAVGPPQAKPPLGQVSSPPTADKVPSPSACRLGLRVLHEPHPQATTVVNIIFVHGLGGSAISTWTSATASQTFWPTLLHEDSRLASARISTFGYDADFKNVLAAKNALGIADFADQLLDGLDSYYGKYGDVSPPNLVKLIQDSHNLCRT
jgi:hypothetical protein